MKKIASLIAIAAVLASVGCKSTGTGMSRGMARMAVGNTVILAGIKDRSVVPYVAVVTPIICRSANQWTNASPNELVQAIEGGDDDFLKTAAAVIVLNSVISLWTAAYEGQTNSQPVLQGICDGLNDGLGFFAKPTGTNVVRATIRRLPPHIE